MSDEQLSKEVERLARSAIGNLSGIAHRGVIAGMSAENGYSVIVIAPRDDLAIQTPSEGPAEIVDGKVSPAKTAKVKAGKVKGDMAKLLKQAESAAIGAAMASTGLAE